MDGITVELSFFIMSYVLLLGLSSRDDLVGHFSRFSSSPESFLVFFRFSGEFSGVFESRGGPENRDGNFGIVYNLWDVPD